MVVVPARSIAGQRRAVGASPCTDEPWSVVAARPDGPRGDGPSGVHHRFPRHLAGRCL